MSESERTFQPAGPTLNTVSDGLELAQVISDELKAGKNVTVDLTQIGRMTPSFANAVVMTILESVGPQTVSMRLKILASDKAVEQSWDKAVDRYGRGIRLSTQRPGAA